MIILIFLVSEKVGSLAPSSTYDFDARYIDIYLSNKTHFLSVFRRNGY